MSQLSEQIQQTVEVLSTDEQQQVLEFIELLRTKRHRPKSQTDQRSQSFLDSAQTLIGAGEGPGDLSTNEDHMTDYGQTSSPRVAGRLQGQFKVPPDFTQTDEDIIHLFEGEGD